MSACRTCNAPIQFARTARGKSIPLDVAEIYVPIGAEIPAGLFKLGAMAGAPFATPVPRDVERLKGTLTRVEDLDRGYGPFHTAHFATCPDAAEHRRSR